MPFLTLPFPDFDPVLVAIGPFSIRWYALAYIVGILLGWAYARMLIRRERTRDCHNGLRSSFTSAATERT